MRIRNENKQTTTTTTTTTTLTDLSVNFAPRAERKPRRFSSAAMAEDPSFCAYFKCRGFSRTAGFMPPIALATWRALVLFS